jgi:NTE family protein
MSGGQPGGSAPVRPCIGLALGSGAARGWAHVGVLRELASLGIEPHVIAGTSIGALVGGAYASGHLDRFEEWICGLDRRKIMKYLDVTSPTGGGFIQGKRLMDFFRGRIGDIRIEDLDRPYGAIATDLASGREVWFRDGSLFDAVRASIALPGLFTPEKIADQWLVDGGLVNPVPVSLCRALGAEVVVAVNLNHGIVGRHIRKAAPKKATARAAPSLFERVSDRLRGQATSWVRELFGEDGTPGLVDVVAGAQYIMQDRITRSRMAGDPPDVVLTPRLAHIRLMDFDRAAEAIDEGRAAVSRATAALQDIADAG